MKVKDKYYMLYVRKVNGINSVVWKKRMKAGTKSVSFQKTSIIVDYQQVIYRTGNVHVLMIDLDTRAQLTVNNLPSSVPAEVIDAYLRGKLGQQIVTGLTQGFAVAWVQIVIGLAIGIPVGIIVAPYVMTGGA